MKFTNSLLLVAFVFGTAAHLPAQVDAERSIARFSVGSGPTTVEVGVGQVAGNVAFDSSDAAEAGINLTIKPGTGSAAAYSEITFKSKRSSLTSDGKLALVGDLSITRIERDATMDPNEGYSGAVYGAPVVHTDTREVTLLLSNPILPAAQNGTMQLSGLMNISREAFPQLLAALAPGTRPSMVVEGEKCTMPSTVGEDYVGAICSGRLVSTAANSVASATVVGGEGYDGFQPAIAPDGSQATIALNLNLTPGTFAPSATPVATRDARN
jgi:hypothetical protein